jgi:TonB family protein
MTNSWVLTCIATILFFLAFPVGGLADQFDSAATKPPPLPKLKSVGKGVAYPDAAKRVGVEGKVIIGFDIAADGRAINISLVSSDDTVFEKPAMELLRSATFELPKRADGAIIHETRYRAGFVFCLPPSSLDDNFPMPVIPIVISSTRMRGSPIRNPPPAGATGQCANG